jgi:RimJ/RimL family protein N-acetyltransferase
MLSESGRRKVRALSDSANAPSRVPVVGATRLILRGHRADDFAACAAMWGDGLVTRYLGGKPFSAEDVWARILRYAGLWALLDFGYWAVEEKSSGRFVGEVGFADFKRAIEPGFDGAPEIGWVLAPWAHGQGFASEAVAAAVAWGARKFGGSRTVCLINPDNAASIRVAQKNGYREYARTTYHDRPTILFQR